MTAKLEAQERVDAYCLACGRDFSHIGEMQIHAITVGHLQFQERSGPRTLEVEVQVIHDEAQTNVVARLLDIRD